MPNSYACARCHRDGNDADVQWRVFIYAMSLVIVSLRRSVQGPWCVRCRRGQAVKWSLFTLVAGPWGIPWGPVWTLQCLYRNLLRGGYQVGIEQLPSYVEYAADQGERERALASATADRQVAVDRSLANRY